MNQAYISDILRYFSNGMIPNDLSKLFKLDINELNALFEEFSEKTFINGKWKCTKCNSINTYPYMGTKDISVFGCRRCGTKKSYTTQQCNDPSLKMETRKDLEDFKYLK